MQSMRVMRGRRLGTLAASLLLLGLCGAALAVRGRGARIIRNWYEGREAEVARRRMAGWPRVMLWAWERPEDFTAIGGDYGVAFLSKTIYLTRETNAGKQESGENVRVRARMQPLSVNPGTPLMAVVRIEAPAGLRSSAYSSEVGADKRPRYSEKQVERVAEEIGSAANLAGVTGVQIDYDAAASEHEFYRRLLVETRRRLPAATRFTITALATWCTGDRWLEELPDGTIDEAVPMVFHMGPGGSEVVRQLQRGEEFPVASCRNSIGVSTNEPLSRDILAGKFGRNFGGEKRTYVFSPRSWTSEMLSQAVPVVSSKRTE